MLCEGLRVVAEAQTGQDNFQEAELSFRAMLDFSQQIWGDSNSVMRHRAQFAKWLTARGRLKEADVFDAQR